jgi:hypothetical protein
VLKAILLKNSKLNKMKIIKDILRYQLRKNSIVYYSENNKSIYCFFDFSSLETTQIKVKRCHWFFNDKEFLKLGFDKQELVGYFPSLKLEKVLNYSYTLIQNGIGIATDYTNSDGLTHIETLFRLPEEKQILKEWLPNSIYHIQDQYWCNDTIEDLKLIDAEKGEILWKIPQPEVEKPYGYNSLTNIKKILGIYKGNLWVQLPDSRILGLDMENGKINHELNHFYFSSIPDGIFLDNKGKIIIFHYNIYAEFSLDSLTFMVDKNLGSEKDLIIRQVTYKSGDKNLYFTGNKDNSFEPNVYGVFNTETHTIQFLKERDANMGYFYQAPQVNNELFAILDEKGNLIIHKTKDIWS